MIEKIKMVLSKLKLCTPNLKMLKPQYKMSKSSQIWYENLVYFDVSKC